MILNAGSSKENFPKNQPFFGSIVVIVVFLHRWNFHQTLL